MSEWISVEDRLPESLERVTLYHKAMGQVTGNLCPDGKHWNIDTWGTAPDWRVSHWMPLEPNPPKVTK